MGETVNCLVICGNCLCHNISCGSYTYAYGYNFFGFSPQSCSCNYSSGCSFTHCSYGQEDGSNKNSSSCPQCFLNSNSVVCTNCTSITSDGCNFYKSYFGFTQ
ncbi:17590_t:CDS:1, partial [Dentiscutata erythropus]